MLADVKAGGGVRALMAHLALLTAGVRRAPAREHIIPFRRLTEADVLRIVDLEKAASRAGLLRRGLKAAALVLLALALALRPSSARSPADRASTRP